METVKRTVCALSNHEWTFDEWEKSFVQATGGMDSPTYIAALQRTVASRVEWSRLKTDSEGPRTNQSGMNSFGVNIAWQCYCELVTSRSMTANCDIELLTQNVNE